MRIEPRYSSVVVSLSGEFNHQELTPDWFARHDLLPRDMTDAAEVKEEEDGTILFTTDWLRFWVDSESINAETPRAPYIRAFDLLARAFGEHLFRTTFLSSYSIRRRAMFWPSDVELYNRIRRQLVFFGHHPGMNADDSPDSLLVMQERQEDVASLHLQRITTVPMIGIEFCNETRVSESTDSRKSKDLMQLLGQRFDDFISHADEVIERTMSFGVGKED